MAATQKVCYWSHIVTICTTEPQVKIKATFPINIPLFVSPYFFTTMKLFFVPLSKRAVF